MLFRRRRRWQYLAVILSCRERIRRLDTARCQITVGRFQASIRPLQRLFRPPWEDVTMVHKPIRELKL